MGQGADQNIRTSYGVAEFDDYNYLAGYYLDLNFNPTLFLGHSELAWLGLGLMIMRMIFQHRPSRGWDRRQCGLGRGASSLFSSSSSPFTLIALIVIITVTIIVSIAMLQVLQAMDAMGFDGNEQGEIISAVRLSISHGDDDYEEIL